MTKIDHVEAPAGDSLETLFRRYATWLRLRLQARVGADAAADLVQETYLRIAPYDRSGIRHPKAFLLRVAFNLLRDHQRRQRRAEDFATKPQVSAHDASQIDQLLLKQIILQMPPLYRDVFVLNRFGGMTYPEIARARGISVKTVEWRMSKALSYCASRLDA